MGNKKPLISVIIPVFNRAPYIKACIESVLTQDGRGTEFEIEVIVIDDGSTDESAKIIKSFGDSVKYIYIKNSGRPAVPRNIGLQYAKGEYIAFQDSDDAWMAHRISSQLKVIRQGYGMVCANAYFMKANGRHTSKTILPRSENHSGDVLSDLIKNNFVCTLTVLMKKNIIKQLGFFNESIHLRAVEDYELWLRCAALTTIQYMPEPLAYYRQHDENISHSNSQTSIRLIIQAYKSAMHKSQLTDAQKLSFHQAIYQQYRALLAELGMPQKLPQYVAAITYYLRIKLLKARKT